MKTSSLVSWHRHTKCASVTGGIGANSFQPVSIRTFVDRINQNNSFSYTFSLDELEKVPLAEDGRSKPVASRQPSVSSARPSNWLASRTLYTKPAPPTTTLHLRCSWNRTSEKTQQRSSSWPYQWKSQKLHLPHHQERRQPQGKNHRRDDTERILFSSPGWRIHKKAKYDDPSDEDEDNPRSAANHDTHKNYPSDEDEDRQARY